MPSAGAACGNARISQRREGGDCPPPGKSAPAGEALLVDAGDVLGLFDAIARTRPERIFARDAEGALTFGRLDRMSRAIAAGLRDRGVAPGERVATMLGNGRPALA